MSFFNSSLTTVSFRHASKLPCCKETRDVGKSLGLSPKTESLIPISELEVQGTIKNQLPRPGPRNKGEVGGFRVASLSWVASLILG